MENLEIEYKVMIGKEDYLKLANILYKLNFKKIKQTNYYFDSDKQIIKKSGLSLRIRKIENKYIITLKEKLTEGRIEYEFEIKDLCLKNIPLKISKILKDKKINLDELKLQGELTTIRLEGKYKEGILCLDYNYYNKQEDYEIEYETNSLKYGKDIVEEFCKLNNINYQESKLSKNARALIK